MIQKQEELKQALMTNLDNVLKKLAPNNGLTYPLCPSIKELLDTIIKILDKIQLAKRDVVDFLAAVDNKMYKLTNILKKDMQSKDLRSNLKKTKPHIDAYIEIYEKWYDVLHLYSETIENAGDNKDEKNKPSKRPEKPEIKIVSIPVNNMEEANPLLMRLLPPELRERLERGEADEDKQEDVQETKKEEKINFDFNMVNCNIDLKTLIKKLKKSKKYNYNLLLYGVSGSGKSYAAEYLAQELGLPVIKKQASSIMDRWVGATERNIREAFKEARKKKAVLILDEADSFLFDRNFAQRDFECTSTNELLTQLELSEYPVVLTTNLKDKLDNACLRRCLFKIKYDYMTAKNIQAGIKTYFGESFELSEDQLKELRYLTAGDFKVARSKMDILEDGKYSNKKIFEYLKAEQNEKNIKASAPIGF